MAGIPVTFVAGSVGMWSIERVTAVRGEGLPAARRLDRVESHDGNSEAANWSLKAMTRGFRYLHAAEHARLRSVEPLLGREGAKRAALIPITKSGAWWELAQDERREIFEQRSHHIATGLRYLPAIARRLYHCRDLGEPFDFLTWFEYAPSDAGAFEELVGLLRGTEEWRYVVRELDVRLSRD